MASSFAFVAFTVKNGVIPRQNSITSPKNPPKTLVFLDLCDIFLILLLYTPTRHMSRNNFCYYKLVFSLSIFRKIHGWRLYFGAIFLITIVLIAIYLNFRSPNIPDADSFYHYKHASIYRADGFWKSDFPWTQYSVIHKYSSDIWYGYHILLIPFTGDPFTRENDPIFGIKLASVLSTVIVFLLLVWAFWRLDRDRFLLWPIIFVTSSSTILFRLIMLRPHPISLAISLLLFSAMVLPSSLVLIFVLGFFMSWLHLALIWLPILIYLTASTFLWRSFRWKDGLALFLGLLAGVFLRPNPIGAIQIAYVQVVEFFLEKQSGLPIQFGSEMLKMSWGVFFRELWPFVSLFLLALMLLFLVFKKRGWNHNWTTLLSSLSLSAIFLLLSFLVAGRSLELSIGFAVIFIALVVREAFAVQGVLPEKKLDPNQHTRITPKILAICGILFILLQIWNSSSRFNFFMRNTARPDTLKASAIWLREHAEPHTIVFNPHWDNFAQLFFWNQNNYYINGMDPIFEYSYDPSLYWKTHYYAVGLATGFTCGETACSKEMASTTEEVLHNDFNASYVVLQKLRTPKFYDYLDHTTSYKKVFETNDEVVFEVKPIRL